jgi:hypothetical protein
MSPDDIYRALRQQPFRPFRLHLSNGRSHEVRHPDLVLVGRTTMIVGVSAPNMPNPIYDDYAVVTLLHVNDLELLPPPPPSAEANGPGS